MADPELARLIQVCNAAQADYNTKNTLWLQNPDSEPRTNAMNAALAHLQRCQDVLTAHNNNRT